MFSCESCENSKNTFFTEHFWTTASKRIITLMTKHYFNTRLFHSMHFWNITILHVEPNNNNNNNNNNKGIKHLNWWKCHYNICIKFQLKNNHFFCLQEDIWTSTNLQLGRGRKVGRLLPRIFQNRHSIMLMKNTSYQYQHVNNKANSKNPTSISLFKFNNRSIRKRCEICWKLIRKTPVIFW